MTSWVTQCRFWPNAKIGAERNPQKTEVIRCVSDLDAGPPDTEVRPLASVATAVHGNIPLGVAQFSVKAWASAESTTSSEYMVPPFFTKKGQPELLEVARKTLPRAYRGQYGTSRIQQPRVGHKMSVDAGRPAHSGTPRRRLPLPLSSPVTTQRTPQPSCSCKKQPKQQMRRGSKQCRGTAAHNHEPNNSRCRTEWHHPARRRRPRTHICSTPKRTAQLQSQLARLSDRT